MSKYELLPEWHKQSGVQLTWPHKETDWNYMLDDVTKCYCNIAREISARERLLIVTPYPHDVRESLLGIVDMERVVFLECKTDDTWARDHGGVTVKNIENGRFTITDFGFNGWGLKFGHLLDNMITSKCYDKNIFNADYADMNFFVLEGGSIECDGNGTLMTTSRCLLSKYRNPSLNKDGIGNVLNERFGCPNVIWLENGYLAGDDTDSHIDTLARFCPNKVIAYVKCDDECDEHFKELQAMERELQNATDINGGSYRLAALPMANPVYDEQGNRLPASYANFLIINGAVLFPTYRQEDNDKTAESRLSSIFPGYDIVGVDCLPLIRQHGSLHCVTMQFPETVLR